MQRYDEKKKNALTNTRPLTHVFSNQTILQLCGSSDSDPDWQRTREDDEQEQRDQEEPYEQWEWRDSYGGFIPSIYKDFKTKNWAGGCRHPHCLRAAEEGTAAFLANDPRWKFSVDHIRSVSHHFLNGGSSMTPAERHEWYNDVANWQAMHVACNSNKNG